MLLTALCLGLLAATPDTPIQVAVPPLKLVNMDAKLADFYTGHLAQQLSFQGVRTLSSSEVAALLGFERQRQLMGCLDDACKAQVSQALGVDGLLVGSVTKLDRSYQLDVRVLSPTNGRPLAGASASSDDNDRLVGTFVVVAEELAKQLSRTLNRSLEGRAAVEIVQGASKVKRLSWIPAVAGGAAAIAGGVFMVQAKGSYDRLTKPGQEPLLRSNAEALARSGQLQSTVGWIGIGVGAAAIAAAAGMFFFGGDEKVRAGVALSPPRPVRERPA
ncbi:MAG: hypothetical protein ACT4TC_26195 [Myxococcaceae bacterium]